MSEGAVISKPKVLAKKYWEANWFAPNWLVFVVQACFVCIAAVFMRLCWAKLRISGIENIASLKDRYQGKPLLIVANHKSYYDPLLVGLIFPWIWKRRPFYFFSKDELFLKPSSRWFFMSGGAFPSFYGSGLDNSLRIPKQLLKEGETVMMFPEGRCIRDESLGEAKVGVGALALSVPNLVILPVAIRGAYRIQWSLPWRRPEVLVNIGQPYTGGESEDPALLAQGVMQSIADLY